MMIAPSTQIHLMIVRARCDGDQNFPVPFHITYVNRSHHGLVEGAAFSE
jgi:hypothetical protein